MTSKPAKKAKTCRDVFGAMAAGFVIASSVCASASYHFNQKALTAESPQATLSLKAGAKSLYGTAATMGSVAVANGIAAVVGHILLLEARREEEVELESEPANEPS